MKLKKGIQNIQFGPMRFTLFNPIDIPWTKKNFFRMSYVPQKKENQLEQHEGD